MKKLKDLTSDVKWLLAVIFAIIFTIFVTAFIINVIDANIPPAKIPTLAREYDANGQCNDGMYTYAHTKQGACSYHNGVKEWY